MTVRKASWATAALAVTALAMTVSPAFSQATGAKPAAPAAAGAVKPAPVAVVVYIDRNAIFRKSSVGVDMTKQLDGLRKKMEAELSPESKKIQADIQALQAQADVLSPQARQAKVKDIETRRAALQKKIQDRELAIRGGVVNATNQIEQALGPIVQKIMVERKANLMLDRNLVFTGATDLDVTNVVIDRLNKALPKVTVTPMAPKAAPKAAAPAKPAG